MVLALVQTVERAAVVITAIKRNTPLSPNLRAHVERFIHTLQVECLDTFVIVAPWHLNHVCRQFEAWYNTERPHEACGHLLLAMEAEPKERTTNRHGDVVCNMRLSGALKAYSRRVASFVQTGQFDIISTMCRACCNHWHRSHRHPESLVLQQQNWQSGIVGTHIVS